MKSYLVSAVRTLNHHPEYRRDNEEKRLVLCGE